ncbi:DNA polymerase IV, partial [mine drainage metagenome]
MADAVRALLREFDPALGIRSIDEAALSLRADTADAIRTVAQSIRQRLDRDLHLPCSIGISPFEEVAKIASDRAKPGGIVIVPRTAT